MKIVIDNAIPFLEGVLEPYAEIRYLPGREIAGARRARRRRADRPHPHALRRGAARRFAGAVIATATIGFDHIDLDYCRRRQIGVATAAGCNARGVLQWIAAVLHHLSQRDRVASGRKDAGSGRRGTRRGAGTPVRRIVGIPRADLRSAACRTRRRRRLRPVGGGGAALRPRHVHTPLDATTRRMADEALLRQLKPKAVVINSSRGEVVDGDALLRSGRPYILDVWEHEPDIDRRLLAGAILATPHIAGYSAQGKANATAMAVGAVARRFALPLEGWYPARRARRIPARSAGTNWPQPSAHATTSPPRATRSNATPNDSRRCATATPTERSISEPVIGNRRLRRERPRPAGRRRRCGHPARNEDEGPAAAGKLSIVRCRL